MRSVGLIVPSSNTCLEPLAARLLADDGVRLHATRVRVTRIGVDGDASAQFAAQEMLAAAELLADADVEVVCWGGTAGSWLGVAADRALCAQIAAATGIPATTSTLAILEALHVLDVVRVGLALPYVREVGAAIVDVYAGEGVLCPPPVCLGLSRNADFAEVGDVVISDLVQAAARQQVEAVAVVCTNVPATSLVPALEARLGLPVVDSIAATVWQLRRLLGLLTPLDGWGLLLGQVPY